MAEIQDPCRQDIDQFCAGVKPGEGRLTKCLDKHAQELSDSCRAEQSDAKALPSKIIRRRALEIQKACQNDAKKFCRGAGAGKEISACLRAHQAKLSARCRSALHSERDGRVKVLVLPRD